MLFILNGDFDLEFKRRNFFARTCYIDLEIAILTLNWDLQLEIENLTLRRPLRRKLRMRWFFDVSKVKESSFFKSNLTDPPQIFDAHLLENTDLSPSRFHFSVGFISRSCFESDGFIAYSNEWDWREKTMFINTN